MADEKKISFGATDNVSPTVNKVYDGIIGKVKQMTSQQKEQVSLLEKEIKLLQQKYALQEKSNQSVIKAYQKERDAAGPGLIKQQFNQQINSERASMGAKS